jgi:transcriptional regulator with GAF, ATPase, and Fis domain
MRANDAPEGIAAWLRSTAGRSGDEVSAVLGRAGVVVSSTARSTAETPGIVLFDALTPDLLDLVREVSRSGMSRVLAVAAPGTPLTPDAAWSLVAAGGSDAVAWDGMEDPGAEVRARLVRWREVDELVASPAVRDHLVGGGRAWTILLRQIVEVARFTDAPVLVTGESGTGKELVARLIHDLDGRADRGEFVILDCTTVVPTLSGSEFFGHERGAFTGAVTAREGALALADGGTLFLDEVGDLPPPLQAELLRAVQEGMYKRVGGNIWRHAKFRLVCATNRDLVAEEAAGRFRRDLYYRIAAWTFRLPPLRDRVEDVLPLAWHFLRRARPDADRLQLGDAVRDLLLTRDYPGNIRDLRQLVFRIAGRHVGTGTITVGDVPPEERPALSRGEGGWADVTFEDAIRRALAKGATLRDISGRAADTAISIAVADEQFNLQRAARRLGVTDRALQLRRASRRQQPPRSHPRSVER